MLLQSLPSSEKLLLSLSLSLSQGNPPAQLIRPIWAAPKCAKGKRDWQWNMTYQTYQYNVSGKKRWISMIPPAGKKSVNVKSQGVAPSLPLWISLKFDTSKPWVLFLALQAQQFPLNQNRTNGLEKWWSLVISNPDLHTDLPGRVHRTDRHDQKMHNGRCQVFIR